MSDAGSMRSGSALTIGGVASHSVNRRSFAEQWLTRVKASFGVVLVLWAGIVEGIPVPSVVLGAEPSVPVRQVQPPEEWNSPAQRERWVRANASDWKRFRDHIVDGVGLSPAPVVIDAVYRATFEGTRLTDGQFDWTIHRFQPTPGFVALGQSSLAVTQLKWKSGDAVHGSTSTGEWMLWSEADADRLNGRWSHRGKEKLEEVVFDVSLPRALSSRLEIRVPRGWVARVLGAMGVESSSAETGDHSLWTFDLGRQQTVQLRLERVPNVQTPRILVRENTVYGITSTDDLIRLRSDLDCTIDGTRQADLLLSVPKTLRVFNVLLGNELPLTFQRELGSEEDQLRIPLRALTPGQRVTLRILGESQRRSDRSFAIPRLRPLNAVLQEGTVRVAVDRPLEVRAVETAGLRQTKLSEEAGQEIRSYEVLANDGHLTLQVGEPAAALQGEILFIADVRGESPVSRVRVRISTREGELFSPQLLIPQGWELISVESAESPDIAPPAWQVTPGMAGDSLLNLELRQPVRPDRDCSLLMEFKSAALPPGVPRHLPIPRFRAAQLCEIRGVVWDNRPWELDTASTGTVELDGNVADEDLQKAVHWFRTDETHAVPTGIHIPEFDSQSKPLFREEGSTLIDHESPASTAEVTREVSLLCASLELETRTSRIGRSHPHRALFQFSRATAPGAFRLTLPLEAELTHIFANEQEISFVRHEAQVVLDPAVPPMSSLILEYRTAATPGLIVSKDEVVFPHLDCFVTEFAWHLILDSERMLYRLPITAAVSPREQPRPGERLLGPLARHPGETLFNPLNTADWKSLMNGTPREGTAPRSHDIWFVAPRIPERLSMKTWHRDASQSLAWCGFLGALVFGIGARRARYSWFRGSWIYLGGAWLVIAVFVAEPYAPIAGGAFLGSLLAIITPRRFAIRRDWLADQRSPRPSAFGRSVVTTGLLAVLGVLLWSPAGHGQATATRPELVYFEIRDGEETVVYFDAAFRAQWEAWLASDSGPPWLLKSSRYDVLADASGPPRMTATYEVAVFGEPPYAPLRLPLEGVSLDHVEGLIDGQPVRLIPADNRRGFVLPFGNRNDESLPVVPPPPPGTDATVTATKKVVTRTVSLKFRPLPSTTEDEPLSFSAILPPLPECVVAIHSDRWRMPAAGSPPVAGSDPIRLYELGPVGQLDLTSGPPVVPPRENLTDVQLRTLIECGPLGGKVQVGVLTTVADPRLPAEVTLALPSGLYVQSIQGPTLELSQLEYLASETRLTLRLRATAETQAAAPVEITAFLPVTASGFQMAPPRWSPQRVSQQIPLASDSATDARADKSWIGVVAKPGFGIVDASPRLSATPISPQSFSDALFAGMVWQVPDLAWTCRDHQGPGWIVNALTATGRAQLAQRLTLQAPRSEWHLEATIDTAQGVPFEHLFAMDPRIEIERVSVQQDGADRLLSWTRMGDEVRLGIRDGQPGTQFVRIEGSLAQGPGPWLPPSCTYRSGLTTESSVTVRNSSRVVSTLQWTDSTTTLRPTDSTADEEVRFHPGTADAPLTIQVEPIAPERNARVWVGLVPRRDSSWQVTLRAQLLDSVPLAAPVRIAWDQPGLTDFRLTNRRDNIRQTADGQTYLWRPQSHSSKPVELALSAVIASENLDSQTIRLPTLSGVVWSEVWVSLPRGAGYRPARASSTLHSTAPTDWPAGWTDSLTHAREDLYASTTRDVTIESTASEPFVRPVLAESLIWLDGASDPASAVRYGVTTYLLIAERDITLEIPDSARAMIRAIAIDGHTQGPAASLRVPSRANDLSHELVVWWQSESGSPNHDPGDLIRLPGGLVFPHWIAVVPPHQQVLLDHWGHRDPQLPEFWLNRSEVLLQAAEEFRGASWAVDGPLLHDLADSRDELGRTAGLSAAESTRRGQLMQRWTEFSQTGGNISAPVGDTSRGLQFSGLDATLSLCGESWSLWLSSAQPPQAWPRLLDRRWALILTASLASIVSLLVLTWVVRLFNRLDIAEKLAAHPHATMAGMGVIWWICLSPSVLGLGLAVGGGVSWGWERVRRARPRVGELAHAPGPTATGRP